VQIVTPTIGTYGAYTTFEYDGFTAFSGYALGDIVTPNVGLPVELTYFMARCENDMVTVNWTTASELNSAYFEVEHSTDAAHFTAIKRIETAQKSNQIKHYEFIDKYPSNGINYYRLKQQDIGNAAATYSNIVQANCNDIITDKTQIFYTINHEIMVNINTDADKEILFKVFEISGKLIHQENKTIAQGNSVFALKLAQPLADGIYIIQMINDDSLSSVKIHVH
jgi:hypothetical protein